MSYQYAVIGAGVSGITCALTLARSGQKVALIEQAPRTAPLLRGFSRHGVHFDTGFHYTGGLGPGEPLELFLSYLGVGDRIETFCFDEQGFDLFRCDDPAFEFSFPIGFANLREQLVASFPAEREAIDSYLDQVAAACNAMPYLNLEAELSQESLLQRVIGPSLREVLDRLTGNELLKSLLSVHSLLYGVSSREVPFTLHAAIAGSYYQSVRGIRGGGLSLARAFDARLAELGVTVLCSRQATGIELSPGGAVSGVRLADGELVPCTAAIATVHPQLLLDLVPEGAFRPVYRKRLASLEETVSAVLCFATCDKPMPGLSGSNRFYVPDTAAMDELGGRTVGNGALYLSAAYRDGDPVPAGFIGICPALYSEAAAWESRRGKRPTGYAGYKEEALERLTTQIARVYPELSGHIGSIEASTPLTVRDYCATPLGGLYGVKHMVGQYNPQPATRVPGLFLSGQAVASPGVMGAVLSGLVTCGTLLGHDRIRKELKGCC
ncbi:phytoene desaturase family protein [Geomonas anaerohicana]|uniref:NAD(P)/FAD-dependent oxidoreductase n=1 Tax=Geomonas anaerohicana TaxID=2798583 RepID=A0ABS0Y8V8_9BACT|nr:NAD(P)/FAD-dependent oxidoreductase [Geomonas anaerohicana]MBJ6748738.1 NAD(P)/FAD-dependent oxidoreductase [Geomonas anaerohicana]